MTHQYRHGIGAMIINSEQKVFVARRLDMSSGLQMPQGGIEKNEPLESALFRELKEEISTNNFQIIHKLNYELYYDFPLELQKKIYNNEFIGQKINWFLLKFNGNDNEINLQTKHPEFSEWQWLHHIQVVNNVIGFKKTMYHTVINSLQCFL